MIPALIGGLFGLMGGAMSSSMGYSNQSRLSRQQYYYQRLLAEQQSDLNSQMWHDQFDSYNRYNDPSAVRARLERAGINPALAMSGGAAAAPQSSGSFSSTGVSQGQAMVPNASFAPLTGLADSMQAFAGARKNMEEAKTQETVRGLNLANTELAKAGVITEKARAAGLEIENFVKENTKFEAVTRTALENNLLAKRCDEVLAHIDVYNAEVNYKNVKSQAEADIARSTVQLQTSQALYTVFRIQNEGKLTKIQERNGQALCNWYGAQVAKINKETEKLGHEIDKAKAEGDTAKEFKKALDAVIRENPNLLYEATKAGFDVDRLDGEWYNAKAVFQYIISPLAGAASNAIKL